MSSNTRWLSCLAALSLWSCGPGVIGEPQEDVAPEEPGELAEDDGTGTEVAESEPMLPACPNGCDEQPLEPIDLEPEMLDAGPVVPVDAGVFDAGVLAGVDAGTPSPWVAGARVLVLAYANFRAAPSSSASLITAAEPEGGVTDSSHGDMPRGQLAPGQRVTLVTGTKTSGFYEVRYDGRRGWITASALAPIDASRHPVSFALGASVRNAFFKHQLRRARWNKDGPWSSGTCAPTSLAMAVQVLGQEPAGLSIEQSIHRARQAYGTSSDSVGTNRAQIATGARALGLTVRTLDTRLSVASMLTRLDQHLAAKRVVVLEGQPGIENAGATAYQQAFNRAYATAGLSNRYTFDGRHSIFLLGKDSAGRYVAGDPLSEVGMVALSAAELKDFFARWGGTGNALSAP